MKKWMKNLLILIATLGLAVMFGCASMMDAVTPCIIEPGTISYAKTAEPNVTPTSLLPYTSLRDAERIESLVNFAHENNQFAWQRLQEDDIRKFDYLIGRVTIHKQAAKEFQQIVFTPEGPIGLLFPTLFGGTLGALLIRRPGDKSPKKE